MSDHVATLADLIRRPSVNPMGRDVSGPEYLEGRITDYLLQRFAAAGIPCARQAVAPGRANVVARLEATRPGGPVLLWDAHQDTVPAEGMTVEPFVPLVRDGRMHGRGACDVKGGMAAMLRAIDLLAAADAPRGATIVFSATVNEEFGFSGARALTRLWSSTDEPSAADAAARAVVGGRPEFAIVAEPTGLDIVTAHKGAVRWRTRIRGRSCHSAFPEQGDNAIYAAGRAVLAVEALARELAARHPDHPCGPPTLSVGTIRGGLGVNLVPDLVVIEIDRRLVPGESPGQARSEVIERIGHACGATVVEHEEPFLESPGLPDAGGVAHAARWTAALSAAASRAGGGRRHAARFGTNASVFAAAGVPGVVFGPGSIAQAHTADEWIDLAEVAAAATTLVELVVGAAAAGPRPV